MKIGFKYVLSLHFTALKAANVNTVSQVSDNEDEGQLGESPRVRDALALHSHVMSKQSYVFTKSGLTESFMRVCRGW